MMCRVSVKKKQEKEKQHNARSLTCQKRDKRAIAFKLASVLNLEWWTTCKIDRRAIPLPYAKQRHADDSCRAVRTVHCIWKKKLRFELRFNVLIMMEVRGTVVEAHLHLLMALAKKWVTQEFSFTRILLAAECGTAAQRTSVRRPEKPLVVAASPGRL